MAAHRITIGPGHLDEDSVPVHDKITDTYPLCGSSCQQEYLARKLLSYASVLDTRSSGHYAGSMLLVSGQVITFGPSDRPVPAGPCAWCGEDPTQSSEVAASNSVP